MPASLFNFPELEISPGNRLRVARIAYRAPESHEGTSDTSWATSASPESIWCALARFRDPAGLPA